MVVFMGRFSLTDNFLEQYKNKKPNFGFNGLGELVYKRTYSRLKEDGTKEDWWETVKRVVEGTYNMQKRHVDFYNLGWNPWKAQKSAQDMYDRIFTFKFTPPGRGLWAMGSPITEERKLFAALNNCGYYSTKDIDTEDPTKPFCFLFDMSMVGAGIGFDVRGEGKITITEPDRENSFVYTVPDSREGWVESLQLLLNSYFKGEAEVFFNYEEIRPAGAPIKGFGGVSSGYEPLEDLHEFTRELLDNNIDNDITGRIITDIMNKIGTCVVAGNIRRSSEIVFGDPNDEEYINLKNYDINPERAEIGWASNNSVFAEVGMDYSKIAHRIRDNGEPGLMWLGHAQDYGRMGDPPNFKDHRALGGNPCLEQTLESAEMCCLVETFPSNHESFEDYKKTIKSAYLYAKTVTLGQIHWVETNRIQLRNRRIGCSVSGVAQFIAQHGIEELRTWLDEGYNEIQRLDKVYSDWLAIPRSIKTTSVKPSGTVSLLTGSTPGVHFPISKYYIRRIRIARNSDLVPLLEEANYPIEPCVGQERDTVVVEFPVYVGDGVRTLEDVSIWEQMQLAAFLQKYWADNQVSCTVTFDPETEGGQIERVLDYYQYDLKGISFLPESKDTYPQMPYEKITKEDYEERVSSIKPLDLQNTHEEAVPEKFCDGDTCLV